MVADAAPNAGVTVSIDCGGTFTDVSLVENATGKSWNVKTSSTPHDPSEGFIDGIEKVLKVSGFAPSEVSQVFHGTTVATNAILEGRGALSAMLTTAGFRHVLEIGRHDIPRNANMYSWVKPKRPVPPERIFEVEGRIDFRGNELWPLIDDDVRKAAETIKRLGIRAVAVCFLHSYANPEHERRARDIILEVHPEAMISLSSEVLPVFREYERSMATLLNVYVMPLVSTYVERLEGRLAEKGIFAPLLLMKSSGGVTSAQTIRREPLLTALSGPAAGISGAVQAGNEVGLKDLITIDIGGTSADICLIKGGRAVITTEGQIGTWPLTVPMIDITTIGAGGGSIAQVSASGILTVGPESAGAVPGPACYGRGGERATVTDAHAVLGNLLPHLLDGALSLDREAAIRVVKADVADPLGLSVEEAAQGIIDVINNNMMAAIRLISIERGHDPRDFALLPFGGAGPLHGAALAELLGARTILLPSSPGVLSSVGLLVADLRSEYSRTSIQHPPHYDIDMIAGIYRDLEADAAKWFEAEQIPGASQDVRRTVSLRYEHQGFELVVDWPSDRIDEAGIAAALAAFEALHYQLYTFNQPGTPIEMVTFRVEAIGRLQRPMLRPPEAPQTKADAKVAEQLIWIKGQYEKAIVFDRRRLTVDQEVHGPAIIQQPDTTTVLLRGQAARVHESGSLLVHSTVQ